jgi:hypothetical protein
MSAPVQVMCSHGGSVFGRGVRWFTHAYASHAAYVVRWGEFKSHVLAANAPTLSYIDHPSDALVVVEADSPGVIARRTLAQVTDPYVLRDYPLDDADRAALYEFLARQLGKGYDWYAIAGFVLRRDIEQRKAAARWICSELVAAAGGKTKRPLFLTTEYHTITPRDVSLTPALVERAA